ncbi:MAG: glutamate--tRNA ligase [Oscillospiraceae bacterium]|nr:glutamate--tRNA ligase [Oscillospiraceae bacterium]
MDYNYLADLLYPNIKTLPADIEAKYPKRDLPEGAKVTRFAPSPTGFVHFGGLFPTRVSERLAHQSGGVFYLRIEDTDNKREVKGAVENLLETYKYYKIEFDEGPEGDYGPYRQTERVEIYQTFTKELIRLGKAYPCFCTSDELKEIRERQKELKLNFGYYGEWAKWRGADIETIKQKLNEKIPFVLRFKSDGNANNKIKFNDLIKGDIELTENEFDHVLLKSNGVPTYHLAHVVDDHLMWTTHVVRGEQWLPSLAFHIQLFNAFGYKMPKYLHNAELLKNDPNSNSRKKLSKRDNAASLAFYQKTGYAVDSIVEYIMTLLNSNYEEWRTANPDKPYTDFPFSVKKMSPSGCLFDFDKLNDVSKNTISRMTAEEVYTQTLEWAEIYDVEFADKLKQDREYALKILSIGRGGNKPRKDLTVWSDVKPYISLFYDDYFKIEAEIPNSDDFKTTLEKFIQTFDINDSSEVWFNKIKNVAAEIGYASEMKEYKKAPENYRGHVGDVSMFIRIAVTGKINSPDMYDVMQILGENRVVNRIKEILK